MSEQSTARIALRVVIQSFVPDHARIDALELVDVLYAPMLRAEEYLGTPLNDSVAFNQLQPIAPPQGIAPVQAPPLVTLENPVPDPSWYPVIHSKGLACHQVAYYLTEKIHRRKKTSLSIMRLVSTCQPPRIGIDQQVCGSCKKEINPFSLDDVDLDPVFYTQTEERMMSAQVDPDLERLNRESKRWQAELPADVEGLIGVAQTYSEPLEEVALPADPFPGVPPTSNLPRLEDLPDPV